MNRIDRLFAITVLLHARRRVRAGDLAALFEVSERTIYRDMDALNESGIPIISTPGEGYELAEGFYLPAVVTFRRSKALLGAEMLKSQASGSLLGNVESALAKIAGALPGPVSSAPSAWLRSCAVQPGRLDLKIRACWFFNRPSRKSAWYGSATTATIAMRPPNEKSSLEALHFSDGAWYVSALCAPAPRAASFRLSRVEALRLQAETFCCADVHCSHQPYGGTCASIPVIRWVRERRIYSFAGEEPDDQG
jgi:predicted DNA-binding transcriptional regulator YafY